MVEIHVFGPFAHGAAPTMTRADLEFYGINHFRPSFVAHIFFNDPDISEDNWTERRPSLAGRFAIFGHQTCVGDEGHCDLVPRRPYDPRPAHPLSPARKVVIACKRERARRLHTILERVVEQISFEGPDLPKKKVKVDGAYVRGQLQEIMEKEDLSKFIL